MNITLAAWDPDLDEPRWTTRQVQAMLRVQERALVSCAADPQPRHQKPED